MMFTFVITRENAEGSFFDRGTLLILTNGFAKKTQKTPLQEIALAIRRKEEYLTRRKKL